MRFLASAVVLGAMSFAVTARADGNGAACADATACDSGFCVDGVCCDQTCGSQCTACDVPGQLGACVAVTGAPHGARSACASSCDDLGRVLYSTCKGADQCVDAGFRICLGDDFSLRCTDGGICPTSCNVDGDCFDHYACRAGACEFVPYCIDSTTAQPDDDVTEHCPGPCVDGQCVFDGGARSDAGASGDHDDASVNAGADAVDDGGGCSASPGRSAFGVAAGLFTLASIGLLRRRKRR